MQNQATVSFQALFKDYPYIAKGLKKLGITSPLDLQEQILSIATQIDNMIITAAPGCGKKFTLMLLAIRRFSNQEQGVLIFAVHSKDLSQELSAFLSAISRVPIVNLFMEKLQISTKKSIIIGSPLQLSTLTKQVKDTVCVVSIPEADLLFGFGYGTHLQNLANSLPSATYQVSCIKINNEIEEFKSKWMKKVAKIDYRLPVEEKVAKIQKTDGQAVHFYEVGDKIVLPTALYVTLKFGLVNPKVLILVDSLKEVYRYHLFLDRVQVPNIGLYNHKNPLDLKFYTLSLWMNGSTNVLISTKEIFEDLNSNIFKQNCKKTLKKDHFALTNLATVVCLNMVHLKSSFRTIFESFNHKPFIMTFVENKEEQVQSLQNFVRLQLSMFEAVKSKQFPISKKELEAFKYRVTDVFMSLGPNKIETYEKYDFKKKVLRSPDLKTYYDENPKEKEALIKQVKQLKQKINSETVTMSQHIPSYLVPECLKSAYEQKMKQLQKQIKNEAVPHYIKKVRNAVRHVDLEEQDPEITDVSRLKLISARKRWKLQHGFQLKKKNIRKQRKGIFETN